jgi:hypothetical protein
MFLWILIFVNSSFSSGFSWNLYYRTICPVSVISVLFSDNFSFYAIFLHGKLVSLTVVSEPVDVVDKFCNMMLVTASFIG